MVNHAMKNEMAKITDSVFIWHVDVLRWKERRRRGHFTNHYIMYNSGQGIQDSLMSDRDLMRYSHEHFRLGSLYINYSQLHGCSGSSPNVKHDLSSKNTHVHAKTVLTQFQA